MGVEDNPLDTDVIGNTFSLSHKPGNFLYYATRNQNAMILPRGSLDALGSKREIGRAHV